MRSVMIKILCLSLICMSLKAVQPNGDDAGVGIKYRISEKQRYGFVMAMLIANLGYTAMAAYFQTLQMTTLPKMTHSLTVEDGVALEDRHCGEACTRNSAIYRDYAENVLNLDGLATATCVVSAINSIIGIGLLGAMFQNWDERSHYKENVDVFTHVAIGASVFTGIFDLASTALLAKLATSYRDGISIVTLGKLQIALALGIAYMAPSFPYVVYGVVRVATMFHDRFWAPAVQFTTVSRSEA